MARPPQVEREGQDRKTVEKRRVPQLSLSLGQLEWVWGWWQEPCKGKQ